MFGVALSAELVVQLSIAFFLVAAAYSSAGFGGGSTYSALLSQIGLQAHQIPLVSLPCNIAVSGAGFFRFLRHRLVPLRELMLICLVSMPAAFLGGRLPVPPRLFFLTLGMTLLFAGLVGVSRLLNADDRTPALREEAAVPAPPGLLLLLGAIIGFVSGIAGIGGGILLSPILLRRTDADPRHVAALASGFIFLNSLAGLGGQIARTGLPPIGELALIATLVLSVLAGGALGTTFALKQWSRDLIRGGTFLLLALAGGKLIVL